MQFIKTKKKNNEKENSTNSRQSRSRSPFEHNISIDTTKEAKEHILKRQQRIQQHHYHRMMSSRSSSVTGSISGRKSLDSSQTSSPTSKTSALSSEHNATIVVPKSDNLVECNNDEVEENESNFIGFCLNLIN